MASVPETRHPSLILMTFQKQTNKSIHFTPPLGTLFKHPLKCHTFCQQCNKFRKKNRERNSTLHNHGKRKWCRLLPLPMNPFFAIVQRLDCLGLYTCIGTLSFEFMQPWTTGHHHYFKRKYMKYTCESGFFNFP